MLDILIIAKLTILTGAASPAWYKIGCFVDDYYRDLEDGPVEYGYNADTCLEACSSFLYFALQDGGQCSCGNEYSTSKNYYKVDASECGEDGLGRRSRNMVYGKVSSVTMNSINWWCSDSCDISFGRARIAWGQRYIQTYATFARPLNLSYEIKNIDTKAGCGILSLFPKFRTRYSGYITIMDWPLNRLSFGVDRTFKSYAKITDHDWHTVTIVATETQVSAYYEGELQATLNDTTYMSGKIRIGYNCRNFAYKNFMLNGGVDTLRPSVPPTSSPSIAPTTLVPSKTPTISPTLSPSVTPTNAVDVGTDAKESTDNTITLLGFDMTHGMAEFVLIILVVIVICLCIPICIACFCASKKALDIRDSGCELVAIEENNLEIMQESVELPHTLNGVNGEL